MENRQVQSTELQLNHLYPGEEIGDVLLTVPVSQPYEHPDVRRWAVAASLILNASPVVGRVHMFDVCSSRIILNRNTTIQAAKKRNCRWVLMCDPDMSPDVYAGSIEGQREFLLPSLAWARLWYHQHGRGCVVGAPASCGPPSFKLNIFGITAEGEMKQLEENDLPAEPSFEAIAAIGTGLILIDMKVFDHLPVPYFNDEYRDREMTQVATGQDIYFGRECNRHGISVFANWYSWAGHWKTCCLGRPGWPEPMQMIREKNITIDQYLSGQTTSDPSEAILGDAPMPAPPQDEMEYLLPNEEPCETKQVKS